MTIKLSAGRDFLFKPPATEWKVDEPVRIHIAGQLLTVSVDDDDTYTIEYLGFEETGFKTLEEAKRVAFSFADDVLEQMRVNVDAQYTYLEFVRLLREKFSGRKVDDALIAEAKHWIKEESAKADEYVHLLNTRVFKDTDGTLVAMLQEDTK
jgi:hypothetical protein